MTSASLWIHYVIQPVQPTFWLVRITRLNLFRFSRLTTQEIITGYTLLLGKKLDVTPHPPPVTATFRVDDHRCDADGRGRTGDAAEEPGRSGERHSSARSHDRYWIQLPPRLRDPKAHLISQLQTGGMKWLLFVLALACFPTPVVVEETIMMRLRNQKTRASNA